MGKQVPNWVATLGVIAALLIVFGIIGQISPSGPKIPTTPKKEAPLFEKATITGDIFRLADKKGSVVLLNFWGTWCGPCRMELPDLISLQKKYGSQGFTIIGVADDNSPEPDEADNARVQKFADAQGITYPNMLLSTELRDLYGGIQAVPTTFLIDKQGMIIFAREGMITEAEIAPLIEKALKG